MATATEEKAVTVFTGYAVQQFKPEEMQEVLSTNLGGATIAETDLDSVTVPGGGATVWSVPSVEGDQASKEIVGVIVSWKETRRYWEDSYASTGGGEPPDCYSDDGLIGVGTPGGTCSKCPMAEFGTATDDKGKPGAGQACQQVRVIAVLGTDDFIPILLNLPPTSLKGIRSYFLGLTRRGIPLYGAVTKFTLKSEKSKGGQKVAIVEATMVEKLADDERKVMASYTKEIKSKLTPARVADNSK